MIAIQTQTGSKVHALEPRCMVGDYDYPFTLLYRRARKENISCSRGKEVGGERAGHM